MEINVYLLIVSLFIIMFALPFIFCLIFKNKQILLKIIISIWFIIYLALLSIGTTANIEIRNSSVKIWYDFSVGWLKLDFSIFSSGTFNIFTNLVMMFPVGFFVFSICEHHPVFKTIILSFIISIIIELYQWILPVSRHTEIMDILLNVASGIISAIYCIILKKLKLIK